VGIAYLLFRIADTFEDAPAWPRSTRLVALAQFATLLRTPDAARSRALARAWTEAQPTHHSGYGDLLAAVPDVLAELQMLPPEARRITTQHVLRSIEGMSETLTRADSDGNVALTSVAELKEYCYIVAGIVGELLTDLFMHDAPDLMAVEEKLMENRAAFGEALQLVNVLKDEDEDRSEGRIYLPQTIPRSQIIALAREDLGRAHQYVAALQEGGAPAGFVAFTALPADLADATLTRIEEDGPGSKVPRHEVMQMVARYQHMAMTPSASRDTIRRPPTAGSSAGSYRS